MFTRNVWRFVRVLTLSILAWLLTSSLTTDPTGLKYTYPQNYFQMPVERKALLSGSFGELRTNHFHAGLDIKSKNGRTGEHIVAAARGYISRIKVQASGYGNALYLAHPNGYTTVYAHLDRFVPDVAAYVNQMQYAQKSFEIDLYPESSRFTFEQGDLIGYLGNSGSSSAPHLHFEIRQSNGQIPVNPVLFGLPVEDQISPSIHGLKSYCLNDQLETICEETHRLVYLGNNRYTLSDTLYLQAWRSGFAVKSYDRMTGAPNRNGIFRMDMLVDDVLQYSFTMERIAFSETRYLNAHIDYGEKVNGGGNWNRCYTLPGNKLSIYSLNEEKGIVRLFENKARKVTCVSYDAAGNTSILEFYVKRQSPIPVPEDRLYHYRIDHDAPASIEHAGFHAYFPAGTFYHNTYLEIERDAGSSDLYLSPVYRMFPWDVAAHRYFTVSIDCEPIDKRHRSKAFVALRIPGKRWASTGGYLEGTTITTRSRELGEFTVMIDTIAPDIRAISYAKDMRGYKTLAFRIDDNFDARGKASDLQYRATIDGNWILMEYDMKRNLITHYFDERTGPGEHVLELEVWDDRNNIARFSGKFHR